MIWWETISAYWHWITAAVAVADVVLLLAFIPWILAIKRDSISALAWCLLVILVPLFGAVLFFLFGYQNVQRPLKRKRAHRRRYRERQVDGPLPGKRIQDGHPVDGYERLGELAVRLGASPTVGGNEVEFFTEGRPAFDAMIAAIDGAKHHVHLESFIFRSDRLGRQFLDLLARKARAGVEVRLLTDGIGTRGLRWWHTRDARRAGVKVIAFLPVSLIRRRLQVNLRNHRKLLICDGRVGFAGGLNVGVEYLGEGPLGRWRDTHLRIQGPSVEAMQRVFVEDWDFAAGEPLLGNKYFPDLPPAGDVAAQVIASGPDEELKPIREIYFAAIAKSRKRLWITSPYYVPDQGIRDALCMAAMSDVDVRLLLPQQPDHLIAHFAARYYLPDLLQAGVKVYMYRPGFIHAKVVLMDGQWASVGSANLDNRSLLLNFEANCLFHGAKVVSRLEEQFRRDLEDSVLIDRKDFAKRPLAGRLAENICRLFAPVL